MRLRVPQANTPFIFSASLSFSDCRPGNTSLIFDGEVLLRASCGERGCSIGSAVEALDTCRSLLGLFVGDDIDFLAELLAATEAVFVCFHALVIPFALGPDCILEFDLGFVETLIVEAADFGCLILFCFLGLAEVAADLVPFDFTAFFAIPLSLSVLLMEGSTFAGVLEWDFVGVR